MAEAAESLRDVLAAGRGEGTGIRSVLELLLKRGLEDAESLDLLGPESLRRALAAVANAPTANRPAPKSARGARQRARTSRRSPEWRAAEGIAPRREADLDDLVLGTRQYAEAIAALLRAARGEVALALFGDWGIGKTTLAQAIADRLKTGTMRYDVVRFSAWQYRKPPETWIFLYETFVRSYLQRTLSIWQRYARTLRVGAARHGVLNLTLLLSGLGLALLAVSLSDWKASLGSLAVLAAAAPAIWTRARAPAKRLASRYAVLATHTDRLGMQATIGDDMRALLRAWQPEGIQEGTLRDKARAVWSARLLDAINPARCEAGPATFALPFIKLGVLVTGVIAFSWLAALFAAHGASLAAASAISLCLWVALCVLCWLALLQRPTDAARILLIVDDLDRCAPGEAMGIIEAIKLLLDDPEMQQRVQVLMLADERTFALATAAKFKRLIGERAAMLMSESPSLKLTDATVTARSEVIREHREKLFLCHLRLGPLTADEAADLGYRFSRPGNEAAGAERSENGGGIDQGEQRRQVRPPPNFGQNIREQSGRSLYSQHSEDEAPMGSSPSMTDDEAALLKSRLAELKPSRQVTPRNIRSLILRYQLARNLVRAGSGGTTPDRQVLDQILQALIDGTFRGHTAAFDKDAIARGTVSYVIAQVS